jgi:hypothetical protein
VDDGGSESRDAEGQAMDAGIITWRYLRLAIIGLGIGLFAAVLWELHLAPHHCLEESISAYFYTPARGMFTGALIGMGVCLLCIRGSTTLEDSFLNLAGIFAPLVALIPTPRDIQLDREGNPVGDAVCASYGGTAGGRVEGYANAMIALVVLGGVALAFLAGYVLIRRAQTGLWTVSAKGRCAWGGAVVLWATGWAIFAWARGWFDSWMHFTAAGLMFTCAWVAIGCNTFDQLARQMPWHKVRRSYLALFIVMPLVAVLVVLLHCAGWQSHWVFWFEVGEIVPFMAFWAVQSAHLWSKTVRP